jgi:hypothetical protein
VEGNDKWWARTPANRWRAAAAVELCSGQKWRKEGGFWPPGLMAYICGDENGPMWNHGRSVRPPAARRSGGDGVVCRFHVKLAPGS